MTDFLIEQNNFGAGILSPEFIARDELETYAAGLFDAVNVLVTEEAGVKRRPGIHYARTLTGVVPKDLSDGSSLARGNAFGLKYVEGSPDQVEILISGDIIDGHINVEESFSGPLDFTPEVAVVPEGLVLTQKPVHNSFPVKPDDPIVRPPSVLDSPPQTESFIVQRSGDDVYFAASGTLFSCTKEWSDDLFWGDSQSPECRAYVRFQRSGSTGSVTYYLIYPIMDHKPFGSIDVVYPDDGAFGGISEVPTLIANAPPNVRVQVKDFGWFIGDDPTLRLIRTNNAADSGFATMTSSEIRGVNSIVATSAISGFGGNLVALMQGSGRPRSVPGDIFNPDVAMRQGNVVIQFHQKRVDSLVLRLRPTKNADSIQGRGNPQRVRTSDPLVSLLANVTLKNTNYQIFGVRDEITFEQTPPDIIRQDTIQSVLSNIQLANTGLTSSSAKISGVNESAPLLAIRYGATPISRTGNGVVIAQHQDRLWVGNLEQFPTRIWASVLGEFNRFSPTAIGVDALGNSGYSDLVTAKEGFAFDVVGAENSQLQAMVSSGLSMLLFFSSSLFAVEPGSEGLGIGPGNFRVRKITDIDCGTPHPQLGKGQEVFFSSGDGKRLYVVKAESGGWTIRDVGLQGRHLLGDNGGIAQIAVTRYPDMHIWIRCNNGALLSCTWKPDHGIAAWTRHTLPFTGADYRIKSWRHGTDEVLYFLEIGFNAAEHRRGRTTYNLYQMVLTAGQTRGAMSSYQYRDSSAAENGDAGEQIVYQNFTSEIILLGVPRSLVPRGSSRLMMHNPTLKRIAVTLQAMKTIETGAGTDGAWATRTLVESKEVMLDPDASADARLFSGNFLWEDVASLTPATHDEIGQARFRVTDTMPMNILKVLRTGSASVKN